MQVLFRIVSVSSNQIKSSLYKLIKLSDAEASATKMADNWSLADMPAWASAMLVASLVWFTVSLALPSTNHLSTVFTCCVPKGILRPKSNVFTDVMASLVKCQLKPRYSTNPLIFNAMPESV